MVVVELVSVCIYLSIALLTKKMLPLSRGHQAFVFSLFFFLQVI